jgi:hypothetical protein
MHPFRLLKPRQPLPLMAVLIRLPSRNSSCGLRPSARFRSQDATTFFLKVYASSPAAVAP